MTYILKANNIKKNYGNYKVLNNVNMHVKKGSIYGLVGKNGAGKTTLIRIITGLQDEASGTYTLFEVSNNNKKINEVRKRVGAIIESPALYLNMSAKDNLIEQCKIIGMPSYDEIDELLELVGLENTKTKKVGNFSLGMKQRLAIALAISSHPDFLILDEPINGLDPEGIIDIRELILKLNRKGITILISSHYLDELSKIATHYGFLNNGKIIKEISSEELKQNMRKKTEIIVNNSLEAVKYFDQNGILYDVVDNQRIIIYDKVNISKLVLDLAKSNCTVIEIIKKDETLESYYMNLIGGEVND